MEKRKLKKKVNFKDSDLAQKILAVAVSIVVWFVLSITLFSNVHKTFNNVTVELILDDSSAGMLGLSAFGFKETKVTVKISGDRYVIGNYTADDLVASLNVDNVRTNGVYELKVEVEPKNQSDKCTIVSISPSTVKVAFDYVASAEFSTVNKTLLVEAPNVSPATGNFVLDPLTLSTDSLIVTGRKSAVEEISHCVIRTTDAAVLAESRDFTNTKICLYDKSGNLLDNSEFVFDNENFRIHAPIYMTKTLPFTVNFNNVPSGFDTSKIKLKYSVNFIDVKSQNPDINKMENFVLGSIDLSSLKIESNFNFNITLPAGYKTETGVEEVVVTLDGTGLSTKKFSIHKDQIVVKNAPDDYNYSILNSSINNLSFIGSVDSISRLTPDDIVAEIDLSNVSASEGMYSCPVLISVKRFDDVWCCGDYYVTLNFTKK